MITELLSARITVSKKVVTDGPWLWTYPLIEMRASKNLVNKFDSNSNFLEF